MAMRVWLFGNLRVEIDGQARALPEGKLQSLFAYFLLHPGVTHRREALAELLWPETQPERQRRNLSTALYRLVQATGEGWLQVKGERLGIEQSENLLVDLWAFDKLAQAADQQALEQLLGLYQGDLLPAIYDEWILSERWRRREIYLNALYTLGSTREEQDALHEALLIFEQLIQAEPLREEAWRGLMRCQAKLGRLSQAFATYQNLEKRLLQELNTRPTVETRALAFQLQAELEVARAVDATQPATRFVGRLGERARLLARLDQARGSQGGIALVLGEAGMGKTRLATELHNATGWRGWQVAWGSGDEYTLPGPLEPLRAALQAALPLPRQQQLSQIIDPSWLGLLAGWLPDAPGSEQSATLAERPQLLLAIRNLLVGLQRIIPHVLILDDVQWADASLWSVLDELRPALAEMAVLVVLCARSDELRQQPQAWAIVEQWDQDGELILHLQGLSREEIASLLGSELAGDQVERVAQISGGNPLLALELARLGEPEELVSKNVTISDLVFRRLTGISNPAQYALQAASVLGGSFEYAMLVETLSQARFPVDRLPTLMGECERLGILTLEYSGYRFTHETLRTAIYTHLTKQLRAEWHRHALSAFLRRADAGQLTLLRHAEEGGDHLAAAGYALAAGQQALQVFSYPSAIRLFTSTLESLPAEDTARRFQALYGRQAALEGLADYPAQALDLQLLGELAGQLGDPQRQLLAQVSQARYHANTGAFERAQEIAGAALARAAELADDRQQAEIHEILGRAARELGDYPQAEACYNAMLVCSNRLDDELGQANALQALGIIAQRTGDYPKAVQIHQQAADRAAQTSNRVFEIRILSNLAIDYWGMGDYVKAAEAFEHSLVVCRQIGDRRAEASALVNLGSLAGLNGDYERSLELFEQALGILRLMHNTLGIATTLSNLATTYSNLGRYGEALRRYQEALALNRQMGRRRGEGYNLHGQGEIYLELGMLDEARQDLELALQIRGELGERVNRLITLAALAQLNLADDQPEVARALLAEALDILQPDMDPDTRQYVHYTASQVLIARGETNLSRAHARLAYQAMQELASELPPEARQRFLANNPLNRKVQAAWQAYAGTITVHLARLDAPMGRKLRESDLVPVTWQIHMPEDEIIQNQAEQRRKRILRLLEEAAAQGGAPTDDDLAQALGVSRRTILRDLAHLAASGYQPNTRMRQIKTPN
jgi:DNA-binding SARP family transcriptional activator/predicted ATPase